jgi:broad specificity phosphatase PhoE
MSKELSLLDTKATYTQHRLNIACYNCRHMEGKGKTGGIRLIRHGHSLEKGRYNGGDHNPPLSNSGVLQSLLFRATVIEPLLAGPELDYIRVITSPNRRAIETAELGYPKWVDRRINLSLCEIMFGRQIRAGSMREDHALSPIAYIKDKEHVLPRYQLDETAYPENEVFARQRVERALLHEFLEFVMEQRIHSIDALNATELHIVGHGYANSILGNTLGVSNRRWANCEDVFIPWTQALPVLVALPVNWPDLGRRVDDLYSQAIVDSLYSGQDPHHWEDLYSGTSGCI